jgi:hypothetical protein
MPVPTSRAIAIFACLAAGCLSAATPRAASTRQVFVCRGAVPVIFSDRPCGLLAEARVLHVHEPGPGGAASVIAAPPKEATRPRVEAHAPDARPHAADDGCRRLLEERERIDDRMRAGYSAREAARLWNRWREIDAKIYAARC